MNNSDLLYYKSAENFLRREALVQFQTLIKIHEKSINIFLGVGNSVSSLNNLIEDSDNFNPDLICAYTSENLSKLSRLVADVHQTDTLSEVQSNKDYTSFRSWIFNEMRIDEVHHARVRLNSIIYSARAAYIFENNNSRKKRRLSRVIESKKSRLELIIGLYKNYIDRCEKIKESLQEITEGFKKKEAPLPLGWEEFSSGIFERLSALITRLDLLDKNILLLEYKPFLVFKAWVFSEMSISEIDSANLKLSSIAAQAKELAEKKAREEKISKRMARIREIRENNILQEKENKRREQEEKKRQEKIKLEEEINKIRLEQERLRRDEESRRQAILNKEKNFLL